MYLSYDDVIQSCLIDDIHWTHSVSRIIIKHCLSEFAIRCPIRLRQLSRYRMVVQKALILKLCFNLRFGCPRTDTCSKCDSEFAGEDHKLLTEAGFQCMSSDRKKSCRRYEHPLHYITKNFAAAETHYKCCILSSTAMAV